VKKNNKIIVIFTIVTIFCTAIPNRTYSAGCVPSFNPISDVDWSVYSRTFSFEGYCYCPPYRYGLKIKYAEPIALIESTQKPFYFPSFNMNLSSTKGMNKVGSQLGDSGTTVNSHFIWYPVFYVLNIISDALCSTGGSTSIDIAYMSEVDSTWTYDELNHYIQPEKLLFANTIAQVACLADCVASTFNYPLDPMFWCAGCWGGIFPDSGNVQEQKQNDIVQSNLIVTRLIDKLHNYGVLWDTIHYSCQPFYTPRIIKSQYLLQPACPVKRNAYTIGTIPVIFEAFAKSPGFEDYSHVIWRKRSCCLL